MDVWTFDQTQDLRHGRLFSVTPLEQRALELLDLWDSMKTHRGYRHVVDIQEHKDSLNGLADMIRLNIYAEHRPDQLGTVCDQFELEYLKVKHKLHTDLIETLQTK